MPVPLGPMRQPWRELLTDFLLDYYGFNEPLAPSSPMVRDPSWQVRNLGAVAPFVHSGKPMPFASGDRAFLRQRINEVEKAGGKLWNGRLARLAAMRRHGGRLELAFGRGTYHDYIACGEALAAELMTGFSKAAHGVRPKRFQSEALRRALFERLDASLPLRAKLAPDREGLSDLTRRVVKVGVVAVTVDWKVGALLVHHRSRKVGEFPGLWSILPGGSIEPGSNSVLEVMKRETLEELGLDSGPALRSGRVALAWDLLSCKLDFLLLLERPAGARKLSPSWESKELRWVSPPEAPAFQRSHPLTPHAAAGFAWARAWDRRDG